MRLIDTHTHLFLEEFDSDRSQVIERAIQSGITKMVLPNVDSSTLQPLFNTCQINSYSLFPAIGLHPCSVKANYFEELTSLKNILIQAKYYAIGEIGIDLYWDKTYFKEQILALEEQFKWAIEHDLPVILHCRESFEQVYEVVKKYKNLRGVFHAFSGSPDQASRVADLGFYMGIGGVVTYKNSGLSEAITKIPIERIILETDSPYLTPVPFRGKRNEPAYIINTAKKLSEIYNLNIEMVAEVTTKNAELLFRI